MGLDDVWPLVYSRRDKAISSLKNNFIEGVDYVAENQPLPLSVERALKQNFIDGEDFTSFAQNGKTATQPKVGHG